MLKYQLLAGVVFGCGSSGGEAVAVASLSGSVSVTDFGAVCDGTANDQVAIQNALNSGAAEVVIPLGTCVLEMATIPAGVTLRGTNRDGSVLLQVAGARVAIRLLYPGANSTVQDLTLDGNTAHQSVNEHRSGTFVANAAGVVVRRVTSRHFTGDGFYTYNHSDNFVYDDVLAENNDRNGITLGGGTTGGEIKSSTFRNNKFQQIDEEGAASFGENIHDNVIGPGFGDFAAAISGESATARSADQQWHDNTILGGINVVWADRIQIQHNVITNSTPQPGIRLWRTTVDVTIYDNTITMTALSGQTAGIFAAGTGVGSSSTNAVIKHNTITVVSDPTAWGVRADGAVSVTVDDNTMKGAGVSSAGYSGVEVRATSGTEDFQLADIRNNWIANWGNFCVLASGNGTARLDVLDVSYNTCSDTAGSMPIAYVLDSDGTHAAKDIRVAGTTLAGNCTTLYGGRALTGVHSGWGDRYVLP